MPAITLSQITEVLGSYVEPDGDFLASLNQVLSRLYLAGTYHGLTVQYSLPVTGGVIALPDSAEAVLHCVTSSGPTPVRDLWHDYKTTGGGSASNALIDRGFFPTMRPLVEVPSPYLSVRYSLAGSTNSNSVDFSAGPSGIKLLGKDADGKLRESAPLTTVTGTVFNLVGVTEIVRIEFADLDDVYDICEGAPAEGRILATIGPNSGVTSYRIYAVGNASPDTQTFAHVLCKRAFLPLRDDSDVSYISNMGAIKHGLLARIAEDNADVERADYHWGNAMILMEEEAASGRGAAIPRLNIDINGMGNGRGLGIPHLY